MTAWNRNILKSAKLCAKGANLCAKGANLFAKNAKWVSGNVGVLGILAVQKLLSPWKGLPDTNYSVFRYSMTAQRSSSVKSSPYVWPELLWPR